MALEMRTRCERCDAPLGQDGDARICSYECTFCETCVEDILHDVCPNCGGGFVARPVRPSRYWKDGNFLGNHPAGTRVRHQPVDAQAHAAFAAPIRSISPHRR